MIFIIRSRKIGMKRIIFLLLSVSVSIVAMDDNVRGTKRLSDESEREEVKKQKRVPYSQLDGMGKLVREYAFLCTARFGHVDSTKRYLQEDDMDVNVTNGYGQTMLMLGIIHQKPEIVKLALQHNADLHKRMHDGSSALHIAAIELSPHMLQLLLRAGANPNARDNNGLTPLHYALDNDIGGETNRFLMCQELCVHGAPIQVS
jgi:hypothetical protein